MKRNTILYNVLVLLFTLGLFSCGEEDQADPVLRVATTPNLTSSADQVVLAADQADQIALTLSWNITDYGFPAAVGYAIQFDQPSFNFDSAVTVTIDTFVVPAVDNLGLTMSVAELNRIATQAGLVPEAASPLVVRVVSQLQDPGGAVTSVDPVYSQPLTLTVTPYSTVTEPGILYVPGEYQGWDPPTAAQLLSAEDNGEYEGYLTFPEGLASLEFKFTPQPSWDLAYGGDATTLDTEGGNLSVSEPGTYFITANLNDLTWSATPSSWGVIGSATAGGWDADQDMAYDYQQNVWTITTELVPGEMKFRLNDAWDTDYGDDDASDNVLNLGGSNIPITEGGTYDIELDLSGDAPTYTLSKQ